MDDDAQPLQLIDIMNAYAMGCFPMAQSADDDAFHWYQPHMRGQLSIGALHIPKRLISTVKQFPFDVRVNTDFAAVIDKCAAPAPGRTETWINTPIKDMFIALHHAGHAHSVECYDHDNQLVGGVYGLALGGAFCAESKFSRATNASKIALVHLCARLFHTGFTILDTQFTNPHLEQFGIYEIPHDTYIAHLHAVLHEKCNFTPPHYDEKEGVTAYLNHLKTQKNQ